MVRRLDSDKHADFEGHPDSKKHAEWRKRFGRFSRCGLTVARFCSLERVSVASFYRWRKQLERAAPRRSKAVVRRQKSSPQQFDKRRGNLSTHRRKPSPPPIDTHRRKPSPPPIDKHRRKSSPPQIDRHRREPERPGAFRPVTLVSAPLGAGPTIPASVRPGAQRVPATLEAMLPTSKGRGPEGRRSAAEMIPTAPAVASLTTVPVPHDARAVVPAAPAAASAAVGAALAPPSAAPAVRSRVSAASALATASPTEVPPSPGVSIHLPCGTRIDVPGEHLDAMRTLVAELVRTNHDRESDAIHDLKREAASC